MKWLRMWAVLALAVIAACGSGDDDKETTGTTPQAAGSTAAAGAAQTPEVKGRLVIYSALDQTTIDAMTAAFKKKYPNVDLNVLGVAAAGEQATRIRAEKDSPKADIFIGGSTVFHEPLAKEGLLLPYKSPIASRIDAKYSDPRDGSTAGIWASSAS